MSKNKLGISKKRVQGVMDEAGAMIQPGNPLTVANALRKACKRNKIPLYFGLKVGKKEFDATMFLERGMVHVSLGTRKRKVQGTQHLKYEDEDEVLNFLEKVVSENP